MIKNLHKVSSVLFTFFLLILFSLNANGQGFTNGSGNTFSLGSLTFSLSGNWSNSGTFTPGTSTVVFNGASGTQTITKSGGESFYNLTVNKASGDVQLLSNVNVSNTITVTSGDIDLNTNELALGTTGTLSETAGNTVKGTSGTITATRTLNAPSSVDAAGLGAVITSSANLGSTSFTRGHAVQSDGTNNSILRYFDISPNTNTELDATLVFNYDDSELNSLTESELELYKSTDGGTNWVLMGGTVNTTDNTVTLSSLDGFSRWTLSASSAPLPVELTSFTANLIDNAVIVNWTTATEVNNYGFEIQKSVAQISNLSKEWKNIGFIEGHGNSNSPKNYSFIDSDISAASTSRSYRLKQIDTDGAFEYSEVIEVEVKIIPTEYKLTPNYPNPFNPTTNINFSLPESGEVKLIIYDILGKQVAELVNKKMEAGVYEQTFDASQHSSGVYIYMLSVNGNRFVKKMNLIK